MEVNNCYTYLLIYKRSQSSKLPGPSGNFRYEALALKYCLVIFRDSTQSHTNPPQDAERLEYYNEVH